MDAVNAIEAVLDGCPSVTAIGDEVLLDIPVDMATLDYNASLAAFVNSSRDMIDLLDDDPSPVRVGRREVYPNPSGRPAVRAIEKGVSRCS